MLQHFTEAACEAAQRGEAASFFALLSREVQLGVADEIIARVHEKASEIESGNGRGA